MSDWPRGLSSSALHEVLLRPTFRAPMHEVLADVWTQVATHRWAKVDVAGAQRATRTAETLRHPLSLGGFR